METGSPGNPLLLLRCTWLPPERHLEAVVRPGAPAEHLLLGAGAAIGATCLFTRLEESNLVPAEFLTAQFLQIT